MAPQLFIEFQTMIKPLFTAFLNEQFGLYSSHNILHLIKYYLFLIYNKVVFQ